jgi:hypothetical protein
MVEQFTALTKKSIQQYINDLITERLKSALKKESEDDSVDGDKEPPTAVVEEKGPVIETTEEERERALRLLSFFLKNKELHNYKNIIIFIPLLTDPHNPSPLLMLV